jgi:quercetin dioxygenase-like cupin family protein
MLTRRGFAGFASCALCAITGFVATEASAQGAPPAGGGVNRKILSKADGPAAGYETVLVEAEIEAGVAVGRHTHPGIESAYVVEGGFELPIEGQATRNLKPGDAFQIPPNTPHAGGKAATTKTRLLITYVVEKGQTPRVAGLTGSETEKSRQGMRDLDHQPKGSRRPNRVRMPFASRSGVEMSPLRR